MNLKGHYPKHKIWGGAQPDIERITEIWTECLATYGGPYLFGTQRGMADAMYAPVVTRFLTYDVPLNDACAAYCKTIMAMPEMGEWIAAALLEPAEIEQLDMDFQALFPGRRGRDRTRCPDVDGLEVRRRDDLQVLHIGRAIEQVMHDAGALVHAITRLDQGFQIAVHELGPTLGHEDDLEFGLMVVTTEPCKNPSLPGSRSSNQGLAL